MWRFGRGIAALCLPCFAGFLLAPMPGPRPDVAGLEGAYGWLIGVDATWNSFPSLHAGLVVFSFLYGWRVLGRELGPRGRRLFVLLSLAWAASILYGTLATKQHWLADLPPRSCSQRSQTGTRGAARPRREERARRSGRWGAVTAPELRVPVHAARIRQRLPRRQSRCPKTYD